MSANRFNQQGPSNARLVQQMNRMNLNERWGPEIADRIDSFFTPTASPALESSKFERDRLAIYNHQQAMQFREETRNDARRIRAYERLEQYDGPVELRKKMPSPGLAFAYYAVEEWTDKGYVCLACHMNLYGFNNLELKEVLLDHKSMETQFKSHFARKLFTGDIIMVHKLRRDSDNGPLKVHEFEVLRRTILKDQAILLTKFEGKRKIVVELQPTLAIEQNLNGRNVMPVTVQEEILYQGDVFVPIPDPFMFSLNIEEAHRKDIGYYEKLFSNPNWKSKCVVFNCIPNEEGLEEMRNWRASCKDMSSNLIGYRFEVKEKLAITAAYNIGKNEKEYHQFNNVNCNVYGNEVEFDVPIEYANTIGLKGEKMNLYLRCHTMKIKITDSATRSDRTIRVRGERLGGDPANVFHRNDDPIVAELVFYGGINHLNVIKECSRSIMHASKCGSVLSQLHGGKMLEHLVEYKKKISPQLMALKLNPEQIQHVRNVLTCYPIMLTHAPFGCGKSLAIIASVVHTYQPQNFREFPPMTLILAKGNYAVSNLVDMAHKVKTLLPHMVRFVTKAVLDELPEEAKTEYDLPVLMNNFYSVILKKFNMEYKEKKSSYRDEYFAAQYCKEQPELKALMCEEAWEAYQMVADTIREKMNPDEYYLNQTKPKVLFCTIDMALTTVVRTMSKQYDKTWNLTIKHIQVDEGSQVPINEIALLTRMYPCASMAIVGDMQQLGPFAEMGISNLVKDIGLNSALRCFSINKSVKSVELTTVYRCDEHTIDVASQLFYEPNGYPFLQSGSDSDAKRRRRSMFAWFEDKSIAFVDIGQLNSSKHGTSHASSDEINLIEKIVITLVNGGVRECEIGIITMYKAQTQLMEKRFPSIKFGTVDSFQGCERDFMIVGLTKTGAITQFTEAAERINVAITRAKIGLVIVGEREAALKAKYWGDLVGNHCSSVNPRAFDERRDTHLASQNLEIRMRQEEEERRIQSANVAGPNELQDFAVTMQNIEDAAKQKAATQKPKGGLLWTLQQEAEKQKARLNKGNKKKVEKIEWESEEEDDDNAMFGAINGDLIIEDPLKINVVAPAPIAPTRRDEPSSSTSGRSEYREERRNRYANRNSDSNEWSSFDRKEFYLSSFGRSGSRDERQGGNDRRYENNASYAHQNEGNNYRRYEGNNTGRNEDRAYANYSHRDERNTYQERYDDRNSRCDNGRNRDRYDQRDYQCSTRDNQWNRGDDSRWDSRNDDRYERRNYDERDRNYGSYDNRSRREHSNDSRGRGNVERNCRNDYQSSSNDRYNRSPSRNNDRSWNGFRRDDDYQHRNYSPERYCDRRQEDYGGRHHSPENYYRQNEYQNDRSDYARRNNDSYQYENQRRDDRWNDSYQYRNHNEPRRYDNMEGYQNNRQDDRNRRSNDNYGRSSSRDNYNNRQYQNDDYDYQRRDGFRR